MSTRVNGEPTTPVSGFQYEVYNRANAYGIREPLPRYGDIVGFTEVSGLMSETDDVAYKPGSSLYEDKLPGMTRAGTVTLGKGIDASGALIRWHKMVAEASYLGQKKFRFDTIIALYDRQGTSQSNPGDARLVRAWLLREAWCKSINQGDLGPNSEILVEQAVLCCYGPPEILVGRADFAPRFELGPDVSGTI